MKNKAIVLSGVLLSCLGSCTQQKEEQKPNVLFIMSDDHASNAISAYHSRLASVMQTPNIDRIGCEGLVLENCFSTNSICTPSRATILTGQYSHVNGVRTLKDDFDPNHKNLGNYFREAGYQTAVIGKWHLHTQPQGFDFWQVLPDQGLYFDPEFKVKGLDSDVDFKTRKMKKYKGYVTDIITDLSLDWLKKRDKKKPFMLFMHHKAPHALWEYNPKYEHLFDGVTIPEPVSLLENKSHRAPETVVKENNMVRLAKRMSGQIKISSVHDYKVWPTGKLEVDGMGHDEMVKAAYQKYLKDYLRCIASVDESVGRVLAYLDKEGLADNTIVVYTSDQGMFLGEHQYLDKRWIFEEGIRMPFLIRWPGHFSKGARVKDLIANVDIAPTLLEVIGKKMPEEMQGNSFLPLLKGGKMKNPNDAIYYRYWMHRDMLPAHFGIRTKRYKLVFYYGLNLDTKSFGHPDSQPAWELYDLEKDPREMHNVFKDPKYKEVKEKLKGQLENLREKVGDTDQKYPEVLKRYMESWN